jgi:uncharacterized protein YcfJ
MKKLALVSTLCTGMLLSNLSLADRYYEEHIDFAKVVDVQPLYETVSYEEPYQQCHYEQRVVRHGGHDSKTGVILGSIIGGAIGHELGHNKSNKKVGAVAGALLGGSIAKDLQHNKRHGYHTTKNERICTTSHEVRYKQELNGYNVTYKYRGKTYYTTMDQHPGNRIRVAVNVRPLGS